MTNWYINFIVNKYQPKHGPYSHLISKSLRISKSLTSSASGYTKMIVFKQVMRLSVV